MEVIVVLAVSELDHINFTIAYGRSCDGKGVEDKPKE